MKQLWMSLLAVTIFSLPALATQPQPAAKSGPTLAELIRTELSTIPGLQPSAGVHIDGATHTKGVITLTGKIAQESQRGQIKAAIQKMITQIQNTLDFKVNDIDLTGLVVSTPQAPPATGSDCPTIRYNACPTISKWRFRICRCR
jgi:hypothetical protein